MAFVNCDDVIQEITPATPYPTLCNSILPRTFERSAERIHLQGSNRCGALQSILGITIKDDEPRSGSKWKCFSQLLHDPRAGRMLCDIEVQDTPTVVTDDEKAIERAEGDRRNSEEVHRGNRFPVITEKGKPATGRLRISRRPFHPTRDRSLRDIRPARQALLGRRSSILVRMATIPPCGHARNGGALAHGRIPFVLESDLHGHLPG